MFNMFCGDVESTYTKTIIFMPHNTLNDMIVFATQSVGIIFVSKYGGVIPCRLQKFSYFGIVESTLLQRTKIHISAPAILPPISKIFISTFRADSYFVGSPLKVPSGLRSIRFTASDLLLDVIL